MFDTGHKYIQCVCTYISIGILRMDFLNVINILYD